MVLKGNATHDWFNQRIVFFNEGRSDEVRLFILRRSLKKICTTIDAIHMQISGRVFCN